MAAIRKISEIDEQVSIARQCGVTDKEKLEAIANAKDVYEAMRIKKQAIMDLD